MNLRIVSALLGGTLVIALSAAATLACIPGIEPVTEDSWQALGMVSVCIVPGDAGAARAYTYPGIPVDGGFRFPVEVIGGEVAGATTSVAVYGADPVIFCEGTLDQLTVDLDGWLTIPFSGGGYLAPDADYGARFFVNLCPNQELDASRRICFNSPDLNGDLIVNLADVTAFAVDFAAGEGYRSDFNWDGVLNVADVGIMAQTAGAGCR